MYLDTGALSVSLCVKLTNIGHTMEEGEEAKEDLEKTEEKLEEIREQNIDPEDPETTKSIKQADSMVKNLRKDKKLTLKKLVKLKQIVGYMSKTLANNNEEEVRIVLQTT